MKANHIILQILVFCSACANRTPARADDTVKDSGVAVNTPIPESFPAGRVIDSVFCKSDPAQSYALYIPARGDRSALPVIYLFDPHGDGALPLNDYKSLADEFGFILIGSNNSKNGNDWPATENIWSHLQDDTQNRLKIDRNRIYTAGFSGGAKVAGYVALQHPGVKGVIAGGAGLPDGTPAGDFAFSFTALAGEGDMNLTELAAINGDLDNTRTTHRILFFDGKHEWAPSATMGLAFTGLQFDAMRSGLLPKDESFIDRYSAKSKQRVDADEKANRLIKAAQECRLSVSLLDGLSAAAAWFREKEGSLAANPLYRQQRQEQENLLITEQNTKTGYGQHFQQDDVAYWVATIRDLNARARAKTLEGAMYQRLLAYLSLAFYSFSNRTINSNANSAARHFVELYKMADPTNPEAWYFSAILHARDGEAQAAENDLLKAVGTGFKDEKRMMQQPEFQNLAARMNFPGIERRMHGQLPGR